MTVEETFWVENHNFIVFFSKLINYGILISKINLCHQEALKVILLIIIYRSFIFVKFILLKKCFYFQIKITQENLY